MRQKRTQIGCFIAWVDIRGISLSEAEVGCRQTSRCDLFISVSFGCHIVSLSVAPFKMETQVNLSGKLVLLELGGMLTGGSDWLGGLVG